VLQVIKMLDAGTVRGLIVATIPLLVLIGSLFGLDEALFQAELEGWGEKVVALVSLGGVAWAAWARIFKPTPPVTETAAKATEARLMAEKSGGQSSQDGPSGGTNIRAPAAAVLIALSVALAALPGCQVLGMGKADSFNERLAAGYSSVTAIREVAAVWVDGQVRTAQAEEDEGRRQALLSAIRRDAQNIQDQADKAREALDVAATLRGLDLKSAEARLASALTILEALQRYVEGI
jgi:hypothetical protein